MNYMKKWITQKAADELAEAFSGILIQMAAIITKLTEPLAGKPDQEQETTKSEADEI